MEPSELHFLDCSRRKLYETWTSKTDAWLAENVAFLAALRRHLPPAIFVRHRHVVTAVSEACTSLEPTASPKDVLNAVDTCLQKIDQQLELSLAFVFALEKWRSQPSIGELTRFALHILAQRLSVGELFPKVVALRLPTFLQIDFRVRAEDMCRPSQIYLLSISLRAVLQAYRGCTEPASIAAACLLLTEWLRMAYWLVVQSIIAPLKPSAFESFNEAFCLLLTAISGSTRSASLVSEFMAHPLFLVLRKAVVQCTSPAVPILAPYLSGLASCRRFCNNIARNLHIFDLVDPCLLLFDRIFLLSVYQQSDTEKRRLELWACVGDPSLSVSVEHWSKFWLVADKNGNPYAD